MAREPVPILDPGERPVDAGRADLELPGTRHRIVDVEHGTDRGGDRLAILDPDLRAVRPVGHHLHGRALAAEHGDAHELVTHRAFVRRLVLRAKSPATPVHRHRDEGPKQKTAARGPPPANWKMNVSPR